MIFAEIEISIWAYIIIFAVVFLAQIYGAFASGGDGLIIQPVLIGLGVPANVAMANDTAGSFFAGVSSWLVFHKNKLMPYNTILWWMPGIIIGPVLGAFLLVYLSLFVLEMVVFGSVIAGAMYYLFRNHIRKPVLESMEKAQHENKAVSLLSGFVTGFLTGFGLGGVGIVTRMLLVFNGLDIKRAMAASQIVGSIPIIPAFITYLTLGIIDPLFLFVISFAFFSGAYVGTTWVVKVDARLLEKVFMISTIAVAVFVLLSRL